MTILRGKLKPVAGVPTNGTVIVFSPRFRPGSDSAITEERTQAPIVDGEFEISVDPGEATFNFVGLAGETSTLETTIPSVDELDLLDLMEGDFEYAPPVVQAAQQAARDARADRVETQRVAAAFGGIERVDALEKSAKTSSTTAEGHRKASKASEDESTRQATRSEQEADRSADKARDSANSAGAAATSEANAAKSEEDSAGHEIAAAGHESRAKGHADTAGEHSKTADGHRQAAATSETNAKTSETNAGRSAADAERSATMAEQRVTAAVADATEITAGHATAAQGASERSSNAARESEISRKAAAESEKAAAEIAIGNVPGATGESRGLVRLGGDLAGEADAPTVPALSLAAPGASVQLTPQEPGWGYATAPAAETPTGWAMDGTWVSPPRWMSSVMVMVDWCGGASVAIRGRRRDGSASTLETIPAGTPESHRPVTIRVDLTEVTALAVAGTWTEEDLEASCTVSLLVVPLPKHSHPMSEVEGLQSALQSKVNGNDDRLDDRRRPLDHTHPLTDVVDPTTQARLDTILDRLMLIATRGGVWFTGDGPPPEDLPGAREGDYWYDETDEELYKITEVLDDDDSD